MSRTAPSDPRARSWAYDSVIVEYQTVHREPRMVFDDLTRAGFEACAALTDAVFDECTEGASAKQDPHVRCFLGSEGPGRYLLGFEVPREQEPPRGLSRLREQLGFGRSADGGDPMLQGRLLSATHLVEDLLLGVDTICSTAPGSLSVGIADSGPEATVEFIDGVRVLRRIHPSTWRRLQRNDVQDLLRRTLAPFQDPELYTMNVKELSPYGSLASNWTMTSSEQLRRFVGGGLLELPELGAPAPQDLLAF